MFEKRIFFSIFAFLFLICSCKGTLNPSDGNESTNFEIKFETNYNGKYTNYTGTRSWTKSVEKGQVIEKPNVQWKGRKVKEWICVAYKSDDSFVSCNYTFDFSEPIEQDLILSAEWELIKYTIEYNLNEGEFSLDPVNYYYISSNDIDLPTPIREGYTFEGWYENSSFMGRKRTSISNGSTDNLILYAKWKQNPIITIIYELNGGVWTDYTPQESYSTLTSFDLPDSEKIQQAGFYFKGWYDNPDFKGFPLKQIQRNSSGTKTLYAKWEAEPVITIIYELNGGSWTDYTPQESYSTLTSFDLPDSNKIQQSGYYFKGWYDNPDFEGSALRSIQSKTTGTKTLYAKWEIINYRITYNLNGGNWENDLYNTSYTIEDAFELPDDKTLKYSGYTFLGWFEDSDFSGSVISRIEKGTIGEKRYYAKWNKNIEEISVTLESVSGDREITIELKDRYYLYANINSNYVNSRINSWYWKVDGIRISENANNTSSYQLYFGNLNLDAGYHNALLVITTENGNIYSATAIITIQK